MTRKAPPLSVPRLLTGAKACGSCHGGGLCAERPGGLLAQDGNREQGTVTAASPEATCRWPASPEDVLSILSCSEGPGGGAGGAHEPHQRQRGEGGEYQGLRTVQPLSAKAQPFLQRSNAEDDVAQQPLKAHVPKENVSTRSLDANVRGNLGPNGPEVERAQMPTGGQCSAARPLLGWPRSGRESPADGTRAKLEAHGGQTPVARVHTTQALVAGSGPPRGPSIRASGRGAMALPAGAARGPRTRRDQRARTLARGGADRSCGK